MDETKTTLSYEDKLKMADSIKTQFDHATSKEEISQIWSKNYLTLGHKVLGRLLIGKTVEQAVRAPKTE